MARRLGRLRRRVLEKCSRRPAGDPPELGDQVRLVREAALVGELTPRHRPGELAGPFEAEDARNRLRREPDLAPEGGDNALAAPAELGRELADRDAPVRRPETPPRPCNLAGGLCVGEPRRE